MVARKRILTAALEVLIENGYQAATVDDIALRAGTSRATFYIYFKGKKDIIAALVEEDMPRYRELHHTMPLGHDASGDEIGAWVSRLLDYHSSITDRSHLYRQAQMLDPDINTMTEANYAAIMDVVQEKADRGGRDRQEHRERIRLFIELLSSTCFLSAVSKQIPRATAHREIVSLWSHYW